MQGHPTEDDDLLRNSLGGPIHGGKAKLDETTDKGKTVWSQFSTISLHFLQNESNEYTEIH